MFRNYESDTWLFTDNIGVPYGIKGYKELKIQLVCIMDTPTQK